MGSLDMTDKPQQKEEVQANNEHVEGDVMQVDEVETDNAVKTPAQSGTDRQDSRTSRKSLVKESEYDNLSKEAKRKTSKFNAKGQRNR